MSLIAVFERKRPRAATVVRATPPAVYMKALFKISFSIDISELVLRAAVEGCIERYDGPNNKRL